MSLTTFKALSLIISDFAIVQVTMASDPGILTDFIGPQSGTQLDGNSFTFTGLRVILGQKSPPDAFAVLKASQAEFPALDGHTVSNAVLQFPAGSINHLTLTHVILSYYSLSGVPLKWDWWTSLRNFKLVICSYFRRDSCIFNTMLILRALLWLYLLLVVPMLGLFQFLTLFNTTIDDHVLALAFNTDVANIRALKKGFAP